MAKRPLSHVIGDKAVSAVSSLLIENGWACEVVKSDYGEDLIAQPCWRGSVDPFRVQVQVKGTRSFGRHTSKKHGCSIVLPRDLFIKWAHGLIPTLVVLWDVEHRHGRYKLISHLTESADDIAVDANRVRITFDSINVFDQSSIGELGWACRLNHYNQLAIVSKNLDEEYLRNDDKQWRKKAVVTSTTAEEFLIRFGFMKGEFLSESFRSQHSSKLLELARNVEPWSQRQVLEFAGLFARSMSKLTRLGIPGDLFVACISELESAFSMEEFIKDEVLSGRISMRKNKAGRLVFYATGTELESASLQSDAL